MEELGVTSIVDSTFVTANVDVARRLCTVSVEIWPGKVSVANFEGDENTDECISVGKMDNTSFVDSSRSEDETIESIEMEDVINFVEIDDISKDACTELVKNTSA